LHPKLTEQHCGRNKRYLETSLTFASSQMTNWANETGLIPRSYPAPLRQRAPAAARGPIAACSRAASVASLAPPRAVPSPMPYQEAPPTAHRLPSPMVAAGMTHPGRNPHHLAARRGIPNPDRLAELERELLAPPPSANVPKWLAPEASSPSRCLPEPEPESEYDRLMAIVRGERAPQGRVNRMQDLARPIRGIQGNYTGKVTPSGGVECERMDRAGWNPNATSASDQARGAASNYLRQQAAGDSTPLPPPGSPECKALRSFGLKSLSLRQLLSGMSLDPMVFNGPLLGDARTHVPTDINGCNMADPKRHQLL